MPNLSLFAIYRSEHFKMQKNIGVYLILLFPILITVFITSYMLYRNSDAIWNIEATYVNNPWKYLLARYIFQFYSLLYPILTSILCFSVCDVEFKNRGYKLIFLLPIHRKFVFLSKLIFILRTLALSIGIAYLTFILAGFVCNYLLPGYKFSYYDVRIITLVYFIRVFAGLLTISMIQLTLSLLTRNFVIPLAFACLASFCALIMQRWDYINFIPYYSGWRAFNDFATNLTTVFTQIELINFGYLAIFLVSSFTIFNRAKV